MSTTWASQEVAGWGRVPVVEVDCARPERRRQAVSAVQDRDGKPVIAHGLGRSYGDAALVRDGRVLLTRRLDRMLDFDAETAVLRCEAGVSLEEVIDTFLPRGFFPPVVPGTRYVTVGGAIGCNIHGKNHHIDGCFGDHVVSLEVLTGRGEIVRCDRETEPELFWATVGGMGLTGLILTADVRLTPVPSEAIELETVRVDNLDEFFAVSAESAEFTHTVSWIDCVATGEHMGRGVYMRGRHAPAGSSAKVSAFDGVVEQIGKWVDPKALRSNLWLNNATIRLFNEAYFRGAPAGVAKSVVPIRPFFFPLDAVSDWNHLYGSRGMLQYQLVVPEHEAVRECLAMASASGFASFLTVIKEFGDRAHGGLSFPEAGVTLALDFPNMGPSLMELLDRLDAVVVEAGGRVYLGKDTRLPRSVFRKMYPDWERWRAAKDTWDPDQVFQSALGQRLGLCGGQD